MHQRIFSGIQPSGNLHLGNYLGAIRHWVQLQHTLPEALFCIVDLHAITVPYTPEALRQYTRETAAVYLAAGIDPSRSAIFHQSSVSGHAELAWLFSCLTPLGWLNRMTQFKEKAGNAREQAFLGLYSYPVLMAADILLYKATHVPVGEDQKQHLELARDIAGAFNRFVNEDYFPLPEPLILGQATRVMNLRDGTKKMSKSDSSDMTRINLTDDSDTIAKKVQKAKSDIFPTITYDPENRPETSNLINIYAALSNLTREQVIHHFEGQGFAKFKKELAELAVSELSPITERIRALIKDPAYLDQLLKEGSEKAQTLALRHLKEIKEQMGFLVLR